MSDLAKFMQSELGPWAESVTAAERAAEEARRRVSEPESRVVLPSALATIDDEGTHVLRALEAVDSGAPIRRVFWCACCNSAEVPKGGEICPVCLPAYARGRREERLKAAKDAIHDRWKRWKGLTLDTPGLESRVQPRHIAAARRSLGAHGVVLSGYGTGEGKTTLAMAMLGTVLERAAAGDGLERAERAMVLSAMYRSYATAEAEDDHDERRHFAPRDIARASRASLLVFDEVGREPGDPAEKYDSPRQDVMRILWSRFDGGRTTWITTPLTIDGLDARYDKAFRRRLEDVGGVVIEVGL